MTPVAANQLIAVLVGALVGALSGFVSTVLLERHRRNVLSRNMALAFKGEINALVTYITETHYAQSFENAIAQMQATGRSVYFPFRFRFVYDRVYQSNVNAIGLLRGDLPGRIPDFYTRMTFVMELMVSIGDGTYSGLDTDFVTGIYRDLGGMLDRALALGREIIAEVDGAYEIETRDEDASR